MFHIPIEKLTALLLAHGSPFSLPTLFSALCIAIAFLLLRRSPGKKGVKIQVMLQALFPKWLYGSASFRADLAFLLFNVFLYGALFGWAAFSAQFFSHSVNGALSSLFGVLPKAGLSDFGSKALVTIALFIAYELGYWTDHYLSHRIPLLWEFHKVHHTAEVLSPVTNFRVHPVDSMVFQNFLALFLGVTDGVMSYLLGGPALSFAVNETNAILLAFGFVTIHLQHTHVWIPASGRLGYVFMSPAHHQLHHSDKPVHFDRNFGSCLALWDWMFGTLIVPAHKRERLHFGILPQARDAQTAMELVVAPFLRAGERMAARRHAREI